MAIPDEQRKIRLVQEGAVASVRSGGGQADDYPAIFPLPNVTHGPPRSRYTPEVERRIRQKQIVLRTSEDLERGVDRMEVLAQLTEFKRRSVEEGSHEPDDISAQHLNSGIMDQLSLYQQIDEFASKAPEIASKLDDTDQTWLQENLSYLIDLTLRLNGKFDWISAEAVDAIATLMPDDELYGSETADSVDTLDCSWEASSPCERQTRRSGSHLPNANERGSRS